jgi:signal transduction histidine kinase
MRQLMQTEPMPLGEVELLNFQPAGISQEIDDFIYLISHDVRGSVRALLELPQWIVEDLEEEGFEVKGQVGVNFEMLNRHTGRLDRMLVDLLAFSRIGRMQQCRRMLICQALDAVLEEFDLPLGFKVKRRLDCESLIIGDRDILTLLNALLINSIKHHDKDTGTIIVTTEETENTVSISIADDGPGIPREYSERVFAAMTTLKPRDEVEGSGMGLAKVRKISRFYGGDALVDASPYGRGTQVTATFRKNPHSTNKGIDVDSR